ncbi:MAG TPA: hypothetical protein VFX23_05015 [Limnobacter sp.]|uniref:tetratricopeptide repeat protein n=1 Tax=Limnobacter sp. TaxID=2003368 RepID=UPI002E335E1A|nr:hypothetical protein [Limnobacter sp.]HEX5485337.1 hypothetical protein [Limnobacter sp.]
MTLSFAFFSLIFLFLIGFVVRQVWSLFFVPNPSGQTPGGEGLANSPEWAALYNTRAEIDSDPLLETESREVLLGNWRQMASEIKSRASVLKARDDESVISGYSLSILNIVAAFVLLGAIGFTWFVGGFQFDFTHWPRGLGQSAPAQVENVDQAVAASKGHPGDNTSMKARIAELETKLKSDPQDLDGWVLLARSQAALGRYGDSAASLKRALQLSPGHPVLLADLADMVAMNNNKNLLGEPEKYIQEALKNDPTNEKAIALAATAAEQAGDKARAAAYWKRLEEVQQQALARQQQMNQTNAGVNQAQNTESTATGQGDLQVRAQVSVPSSFSNAQHPNAALFVFIKGQPGPGMPLAVVRVPASEIRSGVNPVRISSGDFIQGGSLASLPDKVFIQARLAMSGTPASSPDDLSSAWVSLSKSALGQLIELSLTR